MVIRSPPVTVPLVGNIVAIIGGAYAALADSALETMARVRAAPTNRDTNFEYLSSMRTIFALRENRHYVYRL